MAKMALVSFLARPKPKFQFLGLSLLRNQTETLATQAVQKSEVAGRIMARPFSLTMK